MRSFTKYTDIQTVPSKFRKFFWWILLSLLFFFLFYRLRCRAPSRGSRVQTFLSKLPLRSPVDAYYNRYCARRDPKKNVYGNAEVIRQLRWFTNTNRTAKEKDGPLIFYDNLYSWHKLSAEGCEYYCRFTSNFSDYPNAVLAVFTQDPSAVALPKPVNQTWALDSGETPFKMPQISVSLRQHFRIFMTVQSDAHVPWFYGVFLANQEPEKIIPPDEQIRMLNENNTRWLPKHHFQRREKVAALISNGRPNNKRMEYITELAKYIDVHLYGRGQRYCSREGDICLRRLSLQYKFYLAFENSNCKDYITEKLFRNALQYGMLPVVMGTSRDDYCALAPPNSFIHVDDFSSPAELANYLIWLDQNDTAYSSYFAWQAYGKIERNRATGCRLCGFVHHHLKGLSSIPTKGYDYYTNPARQCTGFEEQ